MPLNLNLISYLKRQRLDWKGLAKAHDSRLNTGLGPQFVKAVKNLPTVENVKVDLNSREVLISTDEETQKEIQPKIKQVLNKLKPWRKGPFEVFGVKVESEWDSHLKWKRLIKYISPLKDKRILDVGCNSGYYMMKMLAEDPKFILGIDPSAQYFAQFELFQNYLNDQRMQFLAVGFEDVLGINQEFDTLFCMGILYHRKSPTDFLRSMRKLMKTGGEIILETLTIEGEGDYSLCPKERYAKMRNVYFVPTASCLENWMTRAGFKEVCSVDHTFTTLDEQRKTDWVDSESLDSFLDPTDSSLTIEGYPAPRRTLIIAKA